MKRLILSFCLSFALISCSNIDIDDTYTNYIKGSWQLVKRLTSDGGQGQWSVATDGYTYNFLEDGTLITDKYECNGTYQFKGGRLTLSFECLDRAFEESYILEFEDDFVIMHPNPIICDEGCSEKFRRVTTD